ncbi:MAG TPA: pyridoxal phosphate-dependent aminotransferase [Spirochaetota bacterium]|nr:pyridoxal phosphate-dependent aminotransferase [Spirochaetota bacterium]HPC40936.1 pyridoxal phosphate-dependent aminotransferase [Spirochaetota bacterium]HPL16063.1 pyridoxal phosphate-dependent aminotransferase [Spirochaetota bacterium]HQF08634.1 pyridoxal phosphate-dependent aminotransferase [Spirochaetota bacterium]HQH97349.1 pyridoxal phosphate-dependent aminotransferase [Spirochaetota bacterium]
MIFSERILQVKPSPTLEVTALANALKAKGIDVIGFGTGEPDFDTPDHIKAAAIRAIESGKTKYTPSGGIPELKKAIIEKFKRDNNLEYKPSEVIVNSGGKHSFYNLMQVLLNKGDEIIIPAPYWVSYPPMTTLADGVPVIIETTEEGGFKMTPDQLDRAITPRTRGVVINSPSNPTGSAYAKKDIQALAEVVGDRDILLFSDDMYESILYDGFEFYNIANVSDKMKQKTIVMNGVSKAYSMTGWRIGYMAGDASIMAQVDTLQSQSTSNPTSISQWAAVEALNGDQKPVAEMVEAFARRRALIVEALNKVPGFTCLSPNGAFYAFPGVERVYSMKGWPGVVEKYKSDFNSSRLTSYLLEEARVAVVPGIAFGTDKHIRLSFATSDKNIVEGVKRIDEAIRKLA